MSRSAVSLNALRAFEASARRLSFTRAGEELCVSQAAVSHLVKELEARLGRELFRRSPRGLVLTDEGAAIAPALTEAFDQIRRLLEGLEGGRPREVLTVSVVGTFAVGWLMPRLAGFRAAHPMIDFRLLTNNNTVELAGEGLDAAIRFGDGAWHGVEATQIIEAPLAPLCNPATATTLREPQDLLGQTLLRSYRASDWPAWFAEVGVTPGALRGPIFDSSWLMAQAAVLGEGVALAPPAMLTDLLSAGRLVQPFPQVVQRGAYWLTRLRSRPESPALAQFRSWLGSEAGTAPMSGPQA